MLSSFLPSVLVPLIGLVFPAVTMAALFVYIEKKAEPKPTPAKKSASVVLPTD